MLFIAFRGRFQRTIGASILIIEKCQKSLVITGREACHLLLMQNTLCSLSERGDGEVVERLTCNRGCIFDCFLDFQRQVELQSIC